MLQTVSEVLHIFQTWSSKVSYHAMLRSSISPKYGRQKYIIIQCFKPLHLSIKEVKNFLPKNASKVCVILHIFQTWSPRASYHTMLRSSMSQFLITSTSLKYGRQESLTIQCFKQSLRSYRSHKYDRQNISYHKMQQTIPNILQVSKLLASPKMWSSRTSYHTMIQSSTSPK